MRKSGCLALVVVVAVLARADARSKAPPKGRPATQQPAAAQVAPVEVVEGTGKTRAIALDQAAERARGKVEELLKKRLGEGGWKRRPHQLEPDYLQDMGVITLEGESKEARPDQAVVMVR